MGDRSRLHPQFVGPLGLQQALPPRPPRPKVCPWCGNVLRKCCDSVVGLEHTPHCREADSERKAA